MKVCVLLTQWKRNNLEQQLKFIMKQTNKVDYLIVFQNDRHVDIEHLKSKYNFIHVRSDYNTKYFGRFAYLLSIPADICIVMDDDVIPGINCVKNYVTQCVEKNGIIGGNGRIGLLSKAFHEKNGTKSTAIQPSDVGLRGGSKVDFVGHVWCFKKDWLNYMFRIKPCTYDTGEDMHLCFSSKVYGGISSYVAEHKELNDCGDIAYNKLATDEFSSYRTTPQELRKSVERYWLELGLKFISEN